MEIVGEIVDRLITIEIRYGNRRDRGNVVALYESARKKLGVRSLTLLAAKRMMEEIRTGDNVFVLTGISAMPYLAHGETDGPPSAASIARAVACFLVRPPWSEQRN